MEIKWVDTDPASGERRFRKAERFGGKWTFRYKFQRRGEWTRGPHPNIETWEIVLDALQRRYQRREGVSEADVRQVERIIAELKRKYGDPAAAEADEADEAEEPESSP